ncbi:MAG TPA: retropepsin-like aspartic protease [Ohtaekwangia sp.]|nr:retropepsin-like aspartic protease [Ohtaekwangia sp.]
MNPFPRLIFIIVLAVLTCNSTKASPRAGFYLPDSLQQVTLTYRNINNLILLPVIINDSIQLNLILDTGCRNLVLFGKRFQKLFIAEPGKKVQFSGLGSGRAIVGSLSLNNKVKIGAVLGEHIPIVVIPNRNLFGSYPRIDGVIGYEVFTRFEIELNPVHQKITFRPGYSGSLPLGYTHIPLRIEDSRPIMDGKVVFDVNETQQFSLMIDTGSTLGLLLKTSSSREATTKGKRSVLGRGFNGIMEGILRKSKKLILHKMEIDMTETAVVYSSSYTHASLGMEVLKDYSLILNYSKAYAGLKKIIQGDIPESI